MTMIPDQVIQCVQGGDMTTVPDQVVKPLPDQVNERLPGSGKLISNWKSWENLLQPALPIYCKRLPDHVLF